MYTFLGIVGGLLILLGFYRISSGKWTGKSLIYELDNLVGATLIAFYQVHLKAYVSVALNFIWVIVAIRGIASYQQRRNKKNRRR